MKINKKMQKQINNIYKPSKPISPKDPDFDEQCKKCSLMIKRSKPFNPKDPLKNYSKKARKQMVSRVGLRKDGGL